MPSKTIRRSDKTMAAEYSDMSFGLAAVQFIKSNAVDFGMSLVHLRCLLGFDGGCQYSDVSTKVLPKGRTKRPAYPGETSFSDAELDRAVSR